jgi:DNA mismatch repair protein MutH
MMNDFDPKSASSIIEFAKKLTGQTLREACGKEIEEHGYSGKGNVGQILEKFYFGYKPNSNAEADFGEAGLELKSSSLKALSQKRFGAKERVSLNMIDYLEVHKETFEVSSFWKKNAHLLLVFFLHDAKKEPIDRLIKLVGEWDYPDGDLKIIRQDWQRINKKIRDGMAHELSEGETLYLGACTKGTKSYRAQPFSDIRAKKRAYSLKRSYVDHIVAKISGKEKPNYGKILSLPDMSESDYSIEDFVVSKFEPFYGKSVDEIQRVLSVKLNRSAKGFTANLTKAILGFEMCDKIEEFEKADIRVKTVRLKGDGIPKEHISFPSFKYLEIVKADWESCDFKSILESKFFFVFFQIDGRKLILKRAKFWNMPYSDILEAKKVWDSTVSTLKKGDVVREVKNTKLGKRRYTFFSKPSENKVSHVRPHAKNAFDTYDLPFVDNLTKVKRYTKHCFWLNKEYVRDQIYLQD